jgi:hypothetical protein
MKAGDCLKCRPAIGTEGLCRRPPDVVREVEKPLFDDFIGPFRQLLLDLLNGDHSPSPYSERKAPHKTSSTNARLASVGLTFAPGTGSNSPSMVYAHLRSRGNRAR